MCFGSYNPSVLVVCEQFTGIDSAYSFQERCRASRRFATVVVANGKMHSLGRQSLLTPNVSPAANAR